MTTPGLSALRAGPGPGVPAVEPLTVDMARPSILIASSCPGLAAPDSRGRIRYRSERVVKIPRSVTRSARIAIALTALALLVFTIARQREAVVDALAPDGPGVVRRVPARRDHRARVHQLRLAHDHGRPRQPAAGRGRDAGVLPRPDRQIPARCGLAVRRPDGARQGARRAPAAQRGRRPAVRRPALRDRAAGRLGDAAVRQPGRGRALLVGARADPGAAGRAAPAGALAAAGPGVLDAAPAAARPAAHARQHRAGLRVPAGHLVLLRAVAAGAGPAARR